MTDLKIYNESVADSRLIHEPLIPVCYLEWQFNCWQLAPACSVTSSVYFAHVYPRTLRYSRVNKSEILLTVTSILQFDKVSNFLNSTMGALTATRSLCEGKKKCQKSVYVHCVSMPAHSLS